MDGLLPPQAPIDPMMGAGMDPAVMAMPPVDMGPSDEEMYEMMLEIQRHLEQEWNERNKPMYPPWYNEKDYPKPNAAKILQKALSLETEFAELRRRIEREFAIVEMRESGVFKDFRKGKDNPWYDAGITGEVEHAVAHYADRDIGFDAPARMRSEEDEASKKVDFALWSLEQAARQHSALGAGPLKVEKYRTLTVCGRVAWQIMLNLDADVGESPFLERLVDPSTCYPVYESHRGLRYMFRRYATTIGDAVAAFDTVEENLYNKYFEERSAKSGQFQKVRNENEYCSVTEYWDRRWRAVLIDDQLVLTAEHKYGFVPFEYQMSGLGMPAYMRDPSTASMRDVAGFEISSRISTRDVAAPHKGIGLVSLLRVPHQLREAVITRMLKAFDRSMEPPMGVEIDDINYSKGVPKWSWEAGALNPLRMTHHKLSEVNVDPSLPMLQGIMSAAEDSRSRIQVPPSAHGANDKSNVAGFATNIMNDAGLKKLVANDQSIVDFERRCMEARFRLYRDFGHLIKQGRDGAYGELRIPRSDAMPDQDRTVILTPGDLRRTGIEINVVFSKISLQMMGMVANALGLLKDRGWIDDMEALRILGSPNPYRTIQRIRMNAVLEDPAMIELQVVRGLVDHGMIAEAAFYMHRKMKSAGAPADMMNAAQALGSDPMGGGGESPMGTMMGDSAAQYGMGPGVAMGAGRPEVPVSPFDGEP